MIGDPALTLAELPTKIFLGRVAGEELLQEGLTIAAWVSLWTAFGSLIFELVGIIGNIRIFRRIASREVIFKSSHLAKSLHTEEVKGDRIAESATPQHNV